MAEYEEMERLPLTFRVEMAADVLNDWMEDKWKGSQMNLISRVWHYLEPECYREQQKRRRLEEDC